MDLLAIGKLGLALGLGLLVGFQREWTAPHVAGIRTFTLITLLGTIIGLLKDEAGGWLIALGLAVVAAMIIVGNIVKFENATDRPGLTTQAAALVMYLAGVAIGLNQLELAVFVSGVTAVLLHWKRPLHALVERVGRREIRAVIQLVLIAFVILPVLPDREFGPYAVLNPFEIWLIVVLIVGISLGSYLAYRALGTRAGTILGGLLGGFISSTATTVSHARRSKRDAVLPSLAALVIMLASTVVFIRVMIEVAVVAPAILPQVLPPLATMAGLMAAICVVMMLRTPRVASRTQIEEDPGELKAAILFGLLYAAVLMAVAAVKEHFGEGALYLVAAFSGLTDMDAITLSTAQLISKGRLEIEFGWRMILVGSLSNIFFKGLLVGLIGSRKLLVRISISFGIALAGGLLILLFWPA